MTTFPKIEKSIPIPPKGSGMRGFISSLLPGDSFTCSLKESKTWRVYFGREKVKITLRSLDDNTIRIWVLETPYHQEPKA